MKKVFLYIALAGICISGSSCVSRTTSSEKGFGEDAEEKKLIWIWQKEYQKDK